MGVGDVSASGCGGCISTTDRAHGEGSVAAPGTGHTPRGLYQHQRQDTGRGCICIRLGGVSEPRTGHTARGLYQHQGQGSGRGCLCIKLGGVSAPRTGHRARGVYQHQGQGTGRGCICIRVGVYQHHGQGTRRGACSSTMDRAHRAVSVGTGELA